MPRAEPPAAVFRKQCARGQNICSPVPSPDMPYQSNEGMPARRNPDTPVPARWAYRPPRRYPSHNRTPTRRGSRKQASRFLANAGQRRRQRRAVGTGGPERHNRPTSEGHRVRVSSVVDDAPHHTPATSCLDEPQTPVRPRDNRHSPVAHTTHLSPTNASICATKPCNADT